MIAISDEINKCLKIISEMENKKSPICHKLVKLVNYEISTLRLTFLTMRGTKIGAMCNQTANHLQKILDLSLKNE